MELANRTLLRKFWAALAIAVLAFGFCLASKTASRAAAELGARFVPAIGKVMAVRSPLGDLPAGYLSVLAMLLPVIVLAFLWGESPRARVRYAIMKSGMSKAKHLGRVYLLSMPLVVLMAFIAYAAPFEMPATPHLAGEHILHLMLSTYPGLLLFGSLGVLSLATLLAFNFYYILAPFTRVDS